ncbi:unnamed protein product [Closterium sp. NIES-54]
MQLPMASWPCSPCEFHKLSQFELFSISIALLLILETSPSLSSGLSSPLPTFPSPPPPDLTARFPQVDYRALKKILRRCISSRALRAELQAQAEAELHADGDAGAEHAEADAVRAAAEAGWEEAKAELKRSVANCAVTSCARGELSAPAATLAAGATAAEKAPPAAADAGATHLPRALATSALLVLTRWQESALAFAQASGPPPRSEQSAGTPRYKLSRYA